MFLYFAPLLKSFISGGSSRLSTNVYQVVYYISNKMKSNWPPLRKERSPSVQVDSRVDPPTRCLSVLSPERVYGAIRPRRHLSRCGGSGPWLRSRPSSTAPRSPVATARPRRGPPSGPAGSAAPAPATARPRRHRGQWWPSPSGIRSVRPAAFDSDP